MKLCSLLKNDEEEKEEKEEEQEEEDEEEEEEEEESTEQKRKGKAKEHPSILRNYYSPAVAHKADTYSV